MSNEGEKSAYTDHLFQFRSVEKRKLLLSLSITTVVMVLEIFGGLVTNSIALITDAGHMFTHAFAISISLLAIFIARKPSCHHKTFGLYRAEVLSAFINGLFLIPIVGFIVFEAIIRLLNPLEINGVYMLVIAIIGLIVNISSILILHGSQNDNLNVRSVFYHMIADAASSVGIVIVSITIMYSGWTFLDPLVSFGISLVILYWSYGILKDSTRILLEMTPKGMNIDMINEDLKANFPEIIDVGDTHLWTIIPKMLVYSTHIKINSEKTKSNHEELVNKINEFLSSNYKIIESTIQIIHKDAEFACNI
ncbi:hypothetical protein LCGC14_0590430 [marine sediment metagenome]|uniref:Cation efflux protein cytoplasmic domain-containing protein n=1 Tax=marine sediment metagenome TaxID=412755 RepID=A0A0F9RDL5_9ZZZZ|nr:MAG: Cadmium, cobalt and zinc/H(+)-K(+) antiporter [Candidatus Lokiarchaeum sp. GC14_75]HEA70725.1 cation transporter [archaeon]